MTPRKGTRPESEPEAVPNTLVGSACQQPTSQCRIENPFRSRTYSRGMVDREADSQNRRPSIRCSGEVLMSNEIALRALALYLTAQ